MYASTIFASQIADLKTGVVKTVEELFAGSVSIDNITDATEIGKDILKADDADAVKTLLNLSGEVYTVNSKSPDGSGNVTLTAADVGALSTSDAGAAGQLLLSTDTMSEAQAVLGVVPNVEYGKTLWVDSTNGLDTNNGKSINTPFKTIQAAIDASSQASTIFIAAGNYEGFTLDKVNVDISGMSNRSGLVNITTPCNITHDASSVRLEGLSFTGFLSVAADGATYLNRCSVDTLIKSGEAYLEDVGSDIANISITGSGLVALQSGKYGDIDINNATAFVSLISPLNIAPAVANGINLQSGALFISNTTITTLSSQAVGLTAAAGSTVMLTNVAFVDNARLPTIINVDAASTCFIGNSSFNFATSTVPSVGELSIPVYSDVIRTNNLSLLTSQAQADSTATDVAGLLADFNALLAKLRVVGVLAV